MSDLMCPAFMRRKDEVIMKIFWDTAVKYRTPLFSLNPWYQSQSLSRCKIPLQISSSPVPGSTTPVSYNFILEHFVRASGFHVVTFCLRDRLQDRNMYELGRVTMVQFVAGWARVNCRKGDCVWAIIKNHYSLSVLLQSKGHHMEGKLLCF